jgi:hypothetical protein
MEARENPDYLRSLAGAVTKFRDALVEFLELHIANEVSRGIAPAVVPRHEADPDEIERRRRKVSRAAGLAGAAVPLTGIAVAVQGAGAVDPMAAWQTITRPKPLLEPADVLDACDQAIGRLEGMILKAEAERPPTIGAEAMHPIVWGAAMALWRNGHYREAVAGAAEAVAGMAKTRTRRNDVSETALWQEAFSAAPPQPGKPRLRWPGDPTDRDVKTMNDGLRQFAPGAQMTIRNPATHGTGELDQQVALEQLATLSLLARWVDQCGLDEAP